MPKPNLASLSVDELLKLQTDIENVLSRRVSQLQADLSKLSGHNKKVGVSSL